MSNFQQSAAMSFTDSLEAEINSAGDGLRELFEFSSVWGVADDLLPTGDAYQFSGIYAWILNDQPTANVIDADATVTLTHLDNALDATKNKYRNLAGGKWVFLASPTMISKIGSLQTLVRRQVQQVTFEGGFTMDTYKGVPLLNSGFVAPAATTASVTGLSASAGGTGATSATYRYKVAAITLYGEQIASATAASTLSSQTTCTLTWTENTDAKSYAIYRTQADEADADSNYDLIDIISAYTYDSAGTATHDTSPSYADVIASTSSYTDVHPMATVDETIFLVHLDTLYGASLAVLPPQMGDSYGGDPISNLLRYNQLVETTSSFQFRLESFLAMQVPDASGSAVIRRVSAT